MDAARPLPHPAPSFPGLYAAEVLSASDADHRGRVQVVVPSVYDGDQSAAAVWARPSLPWGCFLMPEEGDHVWVAFEGGDPSAPVWLGQWIEADRAPDDAKVSPPAKRLIRSASGHEVLLDDTSGQEKLLIQHAGGAKIEMTANELTIKTTGTLKVEATQIVLKASSVDVQAA
jgi:uncharacterized protein involved in type VI secretion and phage assembly